MVKIRKYKGLIVFTYLVLTSMLLLNNALFTHSHLFNGTIIVHAHPFDKTTNPPTNHNHSENEILLLNNISLLYLVALPVISFISHILKENKYALLYTNDYYAFFSTKRGRSPPVAA